MRGGHGSHHVPCDQCGGSHENVPTVDHEMQDGEVGGRCPHCGNFHGLGESSPAEVERHPSVPEDEPVTCVCKHCNGSFRVRV